MALKFIHSFIHLIFLILLLLTEKTIAYCGNTLLHLYIIINIIFSPALTERKLYIKLEIMEILSTLQNCMQKNKQIKP